MGLISAIPDGVFAHIIVAFDIHTRQLLPIDFSNLISSTCVDGFALSSDGRLFILYDDP